MPYDILASGIKSTEVKSPEISFRGAAGEHRRMLRWL
jgi:hypothetical protein